MRKTRKIPTVTIEISKEQINGHCVHLFVQDKVIDINGTIPDYLLNKTIGGRKDTLFIVKQVSDEQIANLKEQLIKIVSPKNIEETGKTFFSEIANSNRYTRLKAVIIYKNSIFQINSINILKEEDGSNGIVFGKVR